MPVIGIKSKIRDYKAIFGGVKDYLKKLESLSDKNIYIIDHNVWRIYRKVFSAIERNKIIVLPIAEDKKNLIAVTKLYDRFIELSAKRNATVVSIGGGITQDITGFFASTLYRGIKWIFIPTTFLAQVDSCIGSKTSLNYKSFKNLIGTFYPPYELLIDVDFINTQTKDDFYSGLGEMVKLHIIGGKKYFDFMAKNLGALCADRGEKLNKALVNSLLIKKSFIEADEFDGGRRNLLNYGHCFGHALESACDFVIPHGQAVTIGMIFANIVSRNRGLLAQKTHDFILQRLLFPVVTKKPTKAFLDAKKIIAAMKKDKKRTSQDLPLVIFQDGFKLVRLDNLKEDEVKKALC
jgi:3-dehydroquinate synthase